MACVSGGSCLSHSIRFGDRLAKDLKVQLRVLSVARATFCLSTKICNNPSLVSACCVLSDVKFGYSAVLIPFKIESSLRHFERARDSFRDMQKTPSRVLKTATHSLGGIDKTLSVVRDGMLKPLLFVQTHFDLGKHASEVGGTALIFNIVKSSIKVLHYSGEVMIGIKNIVLKGVSLCFAIVKLILDSLRLARVPVHPLINASFLLIKSLYDLSVVWIKIA